MKFTYPAVLWLLALLPVLAVLHVYSQARKRRALEAFVGPVLAPKLARGASFFRRVVKLCLLLAAGASLIVACARPRFGTHIEEVHRRGLDLIIALDVSNSMLAEDIRPTRLAKAKAEISALIDRMTGDQIGLIAFAGTAFLQCPLTIDYAAARMFLDAIEPETIPVGGTAIGEAIRTAMGAFTSKELRYKVLILVTDGEDTVSDPIKIAQEAAKQGVRIYTIGIGRTDGAPIPMKDQGGGVSSYRKNGKGEVVTSRLDPKSLEGVASATGGRFFQATREEGELERILKEIQGLERHDLKSRTLSHLEDRFQPFVFLALLLLTLEILVSDRSREAQEWGGRFE